MDTWTRENRIIYGTLAVVGLIVLVMAVAGWRLTRRQEKEMRELDAARVLEEYGAMLLGPQFLWAVWQGRLRVSEKQLLVRDQKNQVPTVIHYPSVPTDEVLKFFDFEGEQYHVCRASLLSVRMLLRKKGDDRVLLSSRHFTFRQLIYKGDTEEVLLTLPGSTVFSKFKRVVPDGQDVARIISMEKFDSYSLPLSATDNSLTTLEKLFILATVTRG